MPRTYAPPIMAADHQPQISVAARLHAIASNPGPTALASLLPIAAIVERMERALDEQVANAMSDWRAVQGARFLKRGRFDLVMGGRP